MPIPFIIAGAAIAAAAVGAKKAYDGYQDKSTADYILSENKNKYELAKKKLDSVNEETSQVLEGLGRLQLDIGSQFDEFDKLIQEILKDNEFQNYSSVKLNLPVHKLGKIREVAFKATDYLATVVGGGVSGAAAGFAVYGGVMTLAAASTGTPIAALSGAAAYNATMAAIGGGSLATGGWGMAGGAMVLGTAVVAPILAVAGIAYALHGSKALGNAREIQQKVKDAVEKIDYSVNHLYKVKDYAQSMKENLSRMNLVFLDYFNHLVDLNELIKKGDKSSIKRVASEAHLYIENGIALAAIMANLISQPLFIVKKDKEGKVELDEKGAVQIETDDHGIQVLDTAGIDANLADSALAFDEFLLKNNLAK